MTKTLCLSNTDFIRTTEQRHKKTVVDIWQRLEKSGDIYLDKYSGWYSVSDEAYYDQSEIIEESGVKKSKISGSKVEWFEEETYFFKLSKWGPELLKYFKKNPNFILPKSRMNEVVSFVENGLNDLSISRTSFTWGIKVPNNSNHIIYVWLDALTNYLSSLSFPDDKDQMYNKFWPADLHIIGKDILRFHAVYWPAFLLAANISIPKKIFSHGWILSDDKKMSKSVGNILDPLGIIKDYGIDQLRYYLMKEVSLGNDGNISLKNLQNCINNDLANNFGNLCQRVFAFIKKNCSNKIPKGKKIFTEDTNLNNKISKNLDSLKSLINNQDLNTYIKQVVEYSFDANKYFNDAEPWSFKNKDIERMNAIIFTIIIQIKNISILLSPIIPNSSKSVLDTLNIEEKNRNLDGILKKDIINHEIELKDNNILFKKIEKTNDN